MGMGPIVVLALEEERDMIQKQRSLARDHLLVLVRKLLAKVLKDHRGKHLGPISSELAMTNAILPARSLSATG